MDFNGLLIDPAIAEKFFLCRYHSNKWMRRIQFMRLRNLHPHEYPDWISDMASTLDTLCEVASSEPALKTDRVFREAVEQVIYLCSYSQYKDSERFVNLIVTCFESDGSALKALRNVYAREIHEHFGKASLLEYLMNACFEQEFDLFGCLSYAVKETFQEFWLDSELLFAALHEGSFSDIVFLLRHGITLNDITLEEDELDASQRSRQSLQACLIISAVIDARKTCSWDLQKVLVVCFDVAPYPFVNLVDMRVAAIPHEIVLCYSRVLPQWAFGPRSPRSLKHLSRCAVRDQLHESMQLPRGIEALEIPLVLKQYLDLSEHSSFRCRCFRWCLYQSQPI